MSMDYYQILGVPRDCGDEALHKAFRQLSRERHPDRFNEKDRSEAEKRYQQICIAFNTLKDERQRKRYDKMRPTANSPRVEEDPVEMMKKYYRAGQAKVSAGQYEAAVECFSRAIHYQADPEFYHQKGLAEAKVPRLRKDALASLQRAIELRPDNALFQVELIRLLLEYGLAARAKVYLDKALTQFPDHEELLEIGREVDPKKYKKGLFGQLFHRK